MLASEFGGVADTDIPVVLCYSGSHYEGLVPCTQEDVVLTVELVEWFRSGSYSLNMVDVPVLRQQITKVRTAELGLPSDDFTKADKINAEFESLIKIKPKSRSDEQKKRLKTLQDKRSKVKKSKEKQESDQRNQEIQSPAYQLDGGHLLWRLL